MYSMLYAELSQLTALYHHCDSYGSCIFLLLYGYFIYVYFRPICILLVGIKCFFPSASYTNFSKHISGQFGVENEACAGFIFTKILPKKLKCIEDLTNIL